MKPMNSRTPTVVLPALHGAQAAAWEALLEVAPDFGEGWTLVGGQMVMLHQAERQPSGSTMSGRWSHDLDVVARMSARCLPNTFSRRFPTSPRYAPPPDGSTHDHARRLLGALLDVPAQGVESKASGASRIAVAAARACLSSLAAAAASTASVKRGWATSTSS